MKYAHSLAIEPAYEKIDRDALFQECQQTRSRSREIREAAARARIESQGIASHGKQFRSSLKTVPVYSRFRSGYGEEWHPPFSLREPPSVKRIVPELPSPLPPSEAAKPMADDAFCVAYDRENGRGDHLGVWGSVLSFAGFFRAS